MSPDARVFTDYGERHPDARALHVLFFAGYYLQKRSHDGILWHDKADEEAYRIVRERMAFITANAIAATKEVIRQAKEVGK